MKKALAMAAGVVAALAGTASFESMPVAAERPVVVDEAQIELAKLGITLFSLDTIAAPQTECPAVTLEEMGFWMGQLGMAGTTQGYDVGAFSPDDVEALAILCGVNPADFVATPDPAAPYALALEAFNLLEGATFAQVIDRASVAATPAPTNDPAIGGEVASWCGESTTPGRTICFSFWHRSGLVLDIFMVGPSAELTVAKSQQLLLSMVDNAVTNLAAYESATTGSPTTVAGTPTTAAAAPTTAAATPTTASTAATTLPAQTVPAAPTTAVAPLPTAAPASSAPVPSGPASVPTLPVPTAAVPTVPTPSGATTVPAASTPTVPGAPTTLPAGFVRVSDDSGAISVAIPSTWTDVQTAGLALDDGTTTPQLIASTNVELYESSFDVPGISIVTAAPIADPQSVLSSTGLTGGCATFTTEPYTDAAFTGFAQIGTSCGRTNGSWKMIVGNTIDGATGVVISLQTASPTDQLAIDTALQTLVIT